MFLCLLGEVFDSIGRAKYHISGTWDEKIERTVVGEFGRSKYDSCLMSPHHGNVTHVTSSW